MCCGKESIKYQEKHSFNYFDNLQKRLIHAKKWTIMFNKMNYWLLFKRFNHIDMINTGGKKTISL